MRHVALLGLGLVVLGCGEAALESRRRAITNGQLDPNHPAVSVLIFSLTGGTAQDGACTATLVGKQTALTAAHCVPYPNTAFVVDGKSYDSAKNIAHPSYDAKVSAYLYDVALVRLAAAPPVAPMPIGTSAPVAKGPITFVGFGETTKGAKDNNIKRIATNTIDEVKPYHYTFSGASGSEGNACYGDSGGPVLIAPTGNEVLHGVLSYITGDCGPSTTMAARLDVFLAWLKTESGGDIVILDTVKPGVKITEPADGATVASPVTVRVNASDDQGVTSVELRVDGAVQSTLAKQPWDFTLSLGAGKHQLEAVASDGAGNQASATVSVTVFVPERGVVAPDRGVDGVRRDGGTGRPDPGGCSVDRARDRQGITVICLVMPLALLALARRRR